MLLVEYLANRFPATRRTTFKRMLEARRITVNGKPARKLKLAISETDNVQVHDQPQGRVAEKPNLRKPRPVPLPPIVHEDEHLLVIDKPAGLLTSTTARERRTTLVAVLRDYLKQTSPQARLGIIHRLDRDASGLLVFSKSDLAYKSLKSQFFHHSVQRVYTAVIHGVPTPREGKMTQALRELPDGRVIPADEEHRGQSAVTLYKTLQTHKVPKEQRMKPDAQKKHADKMDLTQVSLVEVRLETGRKHQIRAHFAARNTPIVGDPMYGPQKKPEIRLMLAATTLGFTHPATEVEVTYTVPPPFDVKQVTAKH